MLTEEMVQTVLVLARDFPDASCPEIARAVNDGALERSVVGPADESLLDFARAHLEALLG